MRAWWLTPCWFVRCCSTRCQMRPRYWGNPQHSLGGFGYGWLPSVFPGKTWGLRRYYTGGRITTIEKLGGGAFTVDVARPYRKPLVLDLLKGNPRH
ncbi:hypothetical protein B0H21DRAFT_744876 [Amylocystis lapponica]|nr:hypothetical protein B0H21DRAFT_744876 [Amylocystis lapponica]